MLTSGPLNAERSHYPSKPAHPRLKPLSHPSLP